MFVRIFNFTDFVCGFAAHFVANIMGNYNLDVYRLVKNMLQYELRVRGLNPVDKSYFSAFAVHGSLKPVADLF